MKTLQKHAQVFFFFNLAFTVSTCKSTFFSTKQEFIFHFSFIGEESVAAGEVCVLTDEPTWIVDPIDGTTNFIHRYEMIYLIVGNFCIRGF